MMNDEELDNLLPRGWALRTGYAVGPSVENYLPDWIIAPTFEEAVWRAWCFEAEHFRFQDDGPWDDIIIWPPMPEDWLARVEKATAARDAATVALKALLADDASP